jgi:hypothetical protein
MTPFKHSDISVEYTLDDKRKLASKISKIKNKPQLRKIKNIIYEENENVSKTKSSGGILMYFQNFTTKTYYRIEKFLNAIEKKKMKKLKESLKSTEANISSEIADNDTDYSKVRNRLRLSNKEKRIMKKKEYERDMNLVTEEYDITTLRNTQTDNNDNNNNNNTDTKVVKKDKKVITENIEKIDSSIFS